MARASNATKTHPRARDPLSIEMVAVDSLTPYEGNARTHSDDQVDQIAASITEFGWTNPVLFDDSGLIAGHGRVLAARRLGMPEVPGIRLTGLSEAQRRALVIADNQLALNAEWDEDILRAELEAIGALDFDLGVIGFADDELARLLADLGGETDPDEVDDPPEQPVSVLGDMWLLGDHRLICGDSTDADTVARLLAGEPPPMLMVTDPPYGIEYDAAWRGKAKRSDGKRTSLGVHAKGLVLNDDIADWSPAWRLFLGDVAYVWHAGNMAHIVAESLIGQGLEIRAQIIWAKNNMVIGRGDYHPKHEPCWYAVRKGRPGRYVGGRKQTTVWDIDKPMRSETGHSTQKPVECMRIPIENNSKAGELVYEPFSGSGTTIIAAQMTARRVRAVELNPAYMDVAVSRWEKFTGLIASLEGDGRTFAEITSDRARPD